MSSSHICVRHLSGLIFHRPCATYFCQTRHYSYCMHNFCEFIHVSHLSHREKTVSQQSQIPLVIIIFLTPLLWGSLRYIMRWILIQLSNSCLINTQFHIFCTLNTCEFLYLSLSTTQRSLSDEGWIGESVEIRKLERDYEGFRKKCDSGTQVIWESQRVQWVRKGSVVWGIGGQGHVWLK